MSLEIINKIGLIAEIITIILFLYGLYGERFRIEYKEVILIVIDLIILQSINSEYLPRWTSIFVYVMFAIYSCWRFGLNIKKVIVNNALYIILLSGLQMCCFVFVSFIIGKEGGETIRVFGTNLVMLIIGIFFVKKGKLEKISYYFQRNDILIRIILFGGVGTLLVYIYMERKAKGLYLDEYIFGAIAILVICTMAASWQSYKMQAKEKELELQAYRLYENSYNTLISEIRLKQHEFNNHINAIYSQHLICKSYDELVNRQREYCANILYDNRYEKLLRAGSSVLIGFLYTKFLEAESKNIIVEYDIKCMELQTKLPVYKLIELIGNLLNNAMDALDKKEDKRLFFSIAEELECFYIEVRNVNENLSVEQIAKMFHKGYSSKGENRGLGLYSIRKMGKEYGFEVICKNMVDKNTNWLSFSIELKKSVK